MATLLRPTIAVLALSLTAPALAADWRFVVDPGDGSAVTYVDLDSIAPRNGARRDAATYTVNRDADADGSLASVVRLHFDCPGRRMSIFQIVNYGEDGRQLEDLHGHRPWIGPIPAGTQGGEMIDFVCSSGASHPDRPSLGSALPLEPARRLLREMQQNGSPPGK